ncbi:MAG: fibronectin type III domain-containing protein [Fimbriimonadaceae bacterium]|nr:fibronectin type III domain-containing protein [Fimbriimonadaceae bacterium]
MKAIDEATDFLYGPAGAQKTNFGLPPKGQPSQTSLEKLIEIRTADGLPAHSILFDWENIQNATYEIQWFTNSALTALVGSAVSTQSEFTITGLTVGTQYWMIVRPVRGGEFGPWSDPATRIAPA